jgi:hypothetical protein
MNTNPISQFCPGILRRACIMHLRVVFAYLCLTGCLFAEQEPGGESDRRIMKYLAGLSDDQLGKKLEGKKYLERHFPQTSSALRQMNNQSAEQL